jgi:hypothetical protein
MDKEKMFENRQRTWLESGSEMVRSKPDIRRYTSTERIGSTNMTHSYRLDSNPTPFCEKCSTTATIDHILGNWSVLNAARVRNEINSDIMKNEVDAAIRLVRFLKKIGVYEHI